MKKYEVTADQYGITFNIPHPGHYSVGWWQIAQDGFEEWYNHLMDKRWFTESAKHRFTVLCFAYFNMN